MFRLDVPYYSQHQDVTEPSWQKRSCGIVCTKMVLNYLKPDNKELIDDLIEEGVIVGGYNSDHGWNHESIVRLLRNRGIPSYQEEFRSVLVDSLQRRFLKSTHENPMISGGLNKIHKSIMDKNPVIVSVEPNFDENKTSHLIVLTGFSEDKYGLDGFFYNDPDSREGIKKDKFIELSKFKDYWRNMAIFISE